MKIIQGNMQTPLKENVKISNPNKRSLYTEFILWTAMPYQEKVNLGIEYQQDFAKFYKVTEVTLWRWKNRDDFEKRVDAILKMWANDKTPDVVHSIYRSAIKGNPFSQQLWLGYFKGYNPKKIPDKVEEKVEVSENDIRFIIDGLPEPIRTKFHGYITEIIVEANKIRNARLLDDDRWQDTQPENSIPDETDRDARDVQDTRTNALAYRHTERVREDMVTKVSENNYQSASRGW